MFRFLKSKSTGIVIKLCWPVGLTAVIIQPLKTETHRIECLPKAVARFVRSARQLGRHLALVSWLDC